MTRRLPLLVLPLLLTGAAHSAPRTAPTDRRILRLATRKVEVVSLEEYVAAVLPSEIGGHAPPAAMEAQAIAARSYALARSARHEEAGADLCDGTHCQVFRGREAATAASRRAVEATRGLVLVQNGRVIAAPFHGACGGRTARPRDVWDDEETPDLAAVDDDACVDLAGWSFRIPRAEVGSLGGTLGFPGARFLEVFGRNEDGRVTMIRFVAPGGASRVVRGFAFRRAALAMWGPGSIQSTAFAMDEGRQDYVLSGHGMGHGAGLCQKGAITRALRGESRSGILALYYRGAAVLALDALARR